MPDNKQTSKPSSGASGSPATSPGLAEALKRLNDSLDGLSSSVDAFIVENADNSPPVDETIQAMAADRARLARELDEAEARAVRLGETNSEVAKRIVGAMEIVRGVLDRTP